MSSPFNLADYTTAIVKNSDGSPLDPNLAVTVVPTLLDGGNSLHVFVSLHNTHATNSVANVSLRFKSGWSGGAANHMWVGSPSFKRIAIGAWQESPRPNAYGDANYDQANTGFALAYPCIVMDDGTRCLGLSTDYPGACVIQPENFGGQLQFTITGNRRFYNGPGPNNLTRYLAAVDFIEPGQTVSFNFWIQLVTVVAGNVQAAAIQSISYWKSDFVGAHPNQRPERINGRILAINVAQGEASTTINTPGDNPRQYWGWDRTNPGTVLMDFTNPNMVHPNTHGWYDLLTAMVAVDSARAKGITGVMLWAASGYSTNLGLYFLPGFWRLQPPNLRNSQHEIQQWQRDYSMKVYFWAGSTQVIQAGDDWTSPISTALSRGPYMEGDVYPTDDDTPLANRRHPTFTVEAVAEQQANYVAALQQGPAAGIGIDAALRPLTDPFAAATYLAMRRATYGRKILLEGYNEIVGQNTCASIFSTVAQWDQLRCPLLDVIYPGFQNIVLVHYQLFNTHQEVADFVTLVESLGFCALVSIGTTDEAITDTLNGFVGNVYHDRDVFTPDVIPIDPEDPPPPPAAPLPLPPITFFPRSEPSPHRSPGVNPRQSEHHPL